MRLLTVHVLQATTTFEINVAQVNPSRLHFHRPFVLIMLLPAVPALR